MIGRGRTSHAMRAPAIFNVIDTNKIEQSIDFNSLLDEFEQNLTISNWRRATQSGNQQNEFDKSAMGELW